MPAIEENSSWTTELPTVEGFYWFYGIPSCGAMNLHYEELPQPKTYLIMVHTTKTGVIGITDEQIIGLRETFNRENRTIGPLGYWMPAEIPQTADFKSLFYDESKNQT